MRVLMKALRLFLPLLPLIALAGKAQDQKTNGVIFTSRTGLVLVPVVVSAQDAAKSQAPASSAPQQPSTTPKTLTCTIDTSPKVVPAPLAEALHLYRT